MLERLLVSLLAGGHVLLEGVPGLAKTLTVKTLAAVLGGSYSRIQFTPDLVPADLVGTRVYRPDTGSFDTELGPVFTQLPARRRDQPRAGEGPVGAARGDAGAAGDDRRHDLPGAAAVHRDGDAEPDRVRGHLPAARGAGRPLPDEDPRRLPERRRGGGGRRAQPRSTRPSCASASRSRTCAATRSRARRCWSTAT